MRLTSKAATNFADEDDDELIESQRFSSPVCNSYGQCHESASIGSPRTQYSANTAEQLEEWLLFEEKLSEEGDSVQTLFLGDSITEAFRGTSYGKDCTRLRTNSSALGRCAGIPQVFRKLFEPSSTLALAISGDQTQHLIWRLQPGDGDLAGNGGGAGGGELPQKLQPQVAVVLIGTNNLGSMMTPAQTAKGIEAVVSLLLQARLRIKVLLLALLPRGVHRHSPLTKAYAAKISDVNKQLASTYASTSNGTSSGKVGRVSYVEECTGKIFLNEDGSKVRSDLMPDFLHPNAMGTRLMGECIREHLIRMTA